VVSYSQNLGNQRNSAATVNLVKQENSSEALQDLIDILKQNYVSDCPECTGSGISLRKRVCAPCQGSGKSQGNKSF